MRDPRLRGGSKVRQFFNKNIFLVLYSSLLFIPGPALLVLIVIVTISVADSKLFFSDPDPTFQLVSDLDFIQI